MATKVSFHKFSEEKFFKVSLHPSPQEYPARTIDTLFDHFQLARKQFPDDNPYLDPEKDVIRDSVSPNITDPPEISTDPPRIPTDPPRIPTDPPRIQADEIPRENIQEENIEEKDNQEHISILQSTEGYELLLGGAYGGIFSLLSKKFERNMYLDADEKQQLVDCTLPLLKKYADHDFRYGAEANFFLTAGAILAKKYHTGGSLTVEKTDTEKGTEIFNNLGDKGNQETVAQGLFDLLDSRKEEFSKLPPKDLTEIEFQKVKKVYKELSPDLPDLDYEQACKYASIVEYLGFSVDGIATAVTTMGGEALREMIGNNLK